MILIDANIFIAYYNLKDLHHNSAVNLFENLENDNQKLITTDYVFNEVVGVTLRKMGKDHAIILGEKIMKSMIILEIDEHLLKQAWNIFRETYLKLSLVDCANIAVMKLIQTHKIASFDKEYKLLPNIQVID